MKAATGTYEWAAHNDNCCKGCSHDCRYCYARWREVVRFKRIAPEDWPTEVVNEKSVKRKRKHVEGTVMFPTSHDITPGNLDACIAIIDKHIRANNHLLIVSKPHLECIEAVCGAIPWDRRGLVMFRFTIGSTLDYHLSYWEPCAPSFRERMGCLAYAYDGGFQTSVSAEPLLDMPCVDALIEKALPYVTDAIWIGKMNHVRSRVLVETDEDREMVARIEDGQSDVNVRALYERYKDDPKIKWKDSFKKAVGLEMPQEPGLDI